MTEPTQIVSFRLEPDTIAELRDIANTQGCTVSDLLRRGALMAMEEPNRMVVTWTVPPTVTFNASSVDVRPRTPGGEGDAMGAAITAATAALESHGDVSKLTGSDWWGDGYGGDTDTIVSIALEAAAPLLRQAVAEDIAAEVERNANLWEDYGQHPDGIAGARRAAAIAREIGARP